MGKTIRESSAGAWMEKTVPNWECLFVHRKLGLILSVYMDDIDGWKEAEYGSHVVEIDEKTLTSRIQHHFLIAFT